MVCDPLACFLFLVEYDEYAHRIRQEYSHVPDDRFRLGRAAILEKFLQMKYIYATAEFRALFEEQARLNLRREIELLKAGVSHP